VVVVLEDYFLALQPLTPIQSTQSQSVRVVLAGLVHLQHPHRQLKMAVFHLFLE
jgi:hypothetical protein